MDACALMYMRKCEGVKYDVVDVDPYGSISPFIDASLQAVADGGASFVQCCLIDCALASTGRLILFFREV